MAVLIAIGVAFLIFKNGLTVRNDSIFENRAIFWRMAVEGIRERPWLGYGAESGETFYNLKYAQAEMPLNQLIIDRSHNIFLDVVLWSGFFGLTYFLGWLLLNTKNWWAAAAFLTFAGLQPLGVVHWLLLLLIFKL